MLINWKDLKVGDEIIIPSNSHLKYLKVLKIGTKSHKCSVQKGVTEEILFPWSRMPYAREQTCQTDITKHNSTFYLKDENGYKDIWLVKREN